MNIKNKIKWTKMSGAGNSFWMAHFLPPTALPSMEINWKRVAQNLCQKNSTSPSDGLVILFPSKTCHFKWLFYNADGSSAEMCGNAACCVIDYVFKKKLIPATETPLTLETLSQKITGGFQKGLPCIFLKKNKHIQGPFHTIFENEQISYMYINSSVPHAVIELNLWPSTNEEWETKKKLGQHLRQSTLHHKNGMNVSFYGLKKTNNHPTSNLQARSFERGVENFTPACGTGALAVAQVYQKSFPSLLSISIQMPGGKLTVGFHEDEKISLMSPVQWLEEIEKPIPI